MKYKSIKVMFDYLAFPIWNKEDGIMIDENEINLSDKTKTSLKSWNYRMDKHFTAKEIENNESILTHKELKALIQEGKDLATLVKQEVGEETEVLYFNELSLEYESIQLN